MRQFWTGLLIAALLAAAGWVGYRYYWLPRLASEQTPRYETATVTRGTIANTVSAIGSITPEDEISLAFRGTGRVTEVNVTVGQTISAGEILASLDTTDLVLALAQANVTLQIAEAELALLESPVEESEIRAAEIAIDVARANVAAAEAAVASAQANYQRLLDGPSAAEIQLNEADVRQAEAALAVAQAAYDQVKTAPNISALPQSLELQKATLALEAARAQAALTLQPPDAADLAAANNQIAQAQYTVERSKSELFNAEQALENLREGPSDEELAVARAHVQQAQLSKLQAENSIAAARLEAPLAGMVSQVNVQQGEVPNVNQPDIVLIVQDYLNLKVQVDEIDVRQVLVGQPVRIVVDALPDTDLTGRITRIAPTATNVSGVVAYEVTIVPDPVPAALRPGMSATAIITTTENTDVPLLPNRFIQLDRDTGQAFAYVMSGGEPVPQEVQLGLRNESNSQIIDGLAVGDEVVLVTENGENQFRDALFRRNE